MLHWWHLIVVLNLNVGNLLDQNNFLKDWYNTIYIYDILYIIFTTFYFILSFKIYLFILNYSFYYIILFKIYFIHFTTFILLSFKKQNHKNYFITLFLSHFYFFYFEFQAQLKKTKWFKLGIYFSPTLIFEPISIIKLWWLQFIPEEIQTYLQNVR